MQDALPGAVAPAANGHDAVSGAHHSSGNFWLLALGSVGVVFGDIGTSPLYALGASLSHAKDAGLTANEVIGVISLIIWALFVTVTAKYVLFLMHADNRGEGGTLSLMALAQRALGKRTVLIFFLGVAGSALFSELGTATSSGAARPRDRLQPPARTVQQQTARPHPWPPPLVVPVARQSTAESLRQSLASNLLNLILYCDGPRIRPKRWKRCGPRNGSPTHNC